MSIKDVINCSSCGMETLAGRPFCGKCGAKIAEVCGECGSVLATDDKFCTACGSSGKGRGSECPTCKAPVRYRNQPFCTECGMMMIVQCASCGAPISSEWKFCAHCGRDLNSDKVDIRTANRIREKYGTVNNTVNVAEDDAEAYNNRGLNFFENDEYDAAVSDFRAAVEIDPENASYHCNLAAALEGIEEIEEALREYEHVLHLNPGDSTALLAIGYIYSERENYVEAEAVWKSLVDNAPNSAEAREAAENLKHLKEM